MALIGPCSPEAEPGGWEPGSLLAFELESCTPAPGLSELLRSDTNAAAAAAPDATVDDDEEAAALFGSLPEPALYRSRCSILSVRYNVRIGK